MSFWRVFAIPAFARYWLGDLLAGFVAESMQVAMLWYLGTSGQGSQALGWQVFLSAAPVAAGGPVVAFLFRRLSVRAVMLFDLGVRSLAYVSLALALWAAGDHVAAPGVFYLVAAATAFLSMASSAGGPALWPRLLPAHEIRHAMQAEQLGWNLAPALGPVLAGVLVARTGLAPIATAAAVLVAVTALNLGTIVLRAGSAPERPAPDAIRPGGLRQVAGLVLRDRRLWLTTALFWVVNLAGGAVQVFLPLIVHLFWHGGAGIYGALLAAASLGGIAGSTTLAGLSAGNAMRRVLLGELAASAVMLLLLPGLDQPLFAFAAMAASSAIGAATATWVLGIRFDATDDDLRPHVLAYVRTFLWTAAPVGGLLAGALWRPAWAPVLLAFGSCLTASAALAGMGLISAGGRVKARSHGLS